VLVGLGKLDRAISDYTAAILLDRTFAPAYLGRADVLAKRGEHTRAVTDYTRYITLRPKDWQGFLSRATAYKALGKTDLADADAATAVKLRRAAREKRKALPARRKTPSAAGQ